MTQEDDIVVAPDLSNDAGVVVPCVTSLELPEDGFVLESGEKLQKIEVAWESCGLEKAENDNVVFVCHALTGDAHVAGHYEGETKPTGWWNGIVGPGKAIDTKRYRVICANVLGGCKGTTGPSSTNPATGKPYGSAFPRFTIGDTVRVYRELLRQLGIKKLAHLVGGSFGGIQVLEWVTAFPDEVENAIVIASGAALNAQALAFDIVGRRAITEDPKWNGGDYYGTPGPVTGLAAARQVAHITYLSLELINQKFGRKLQQSWLARGPEFLAEQYRNFGTVFQIESYLGYQAEKFISRFDANSYLQITHAMDRYNLAEKWGSLEQACARIKARLLLISLSGDWLFSEDQSREIASAMLKEGKSVSYSHLDIRVGHDGFLTHIDELSRVMSAFISRPNSGNIKQYKRNKFEAALKMIKNGSRVLDIGCGSGSMLTILRKEKNVKGVGIDINFKKITHAIGRGNDIIYEDADEGLTLIPDQAYDMAILLETLQTVKYPRELLRQMLRVAKEGVVSFTNFASLMVRVQLGIYGHMPVGKQMPFEWYNTPNIHFFTLKDFIALCKEERIEILELDVKARDWLSKLLLLLGFKNVGAFKVVARIAKKK